MCGLTVFAGLNIQDVASYSISSLSEGQNLDAVVGELLQAFQLYLLLDSCNILHFTPLWEKMNKKRGSGWTKMNRFFLFLILGCQIDTTYLHLERQPKTRPDIPSKLHAESFLEAQPMWSPPRRKWQRWLARSEGADWALETESEMVD